MNYLGRREVEPERETKRSDVASALLKFSFLDVVIGKDLGLGEDGGVMDSGSTKPYRSLNLEATLFSSACW